MNCNKCEPDDYLSKSWSYKTELSPLVRYSVSPRPHINGAKGFSLQTPCNLGRNQAKDLQNEKRYSSYETYLDSKAKDEVAQYDIRHHTIKIYFLTKV